MALTADQTAILELLLGSDDGFRDLGEILGLDEDEVRRRAREALGELGGADPDRNVELSVYLLGRADAIGRADAVRHLRQDAADHALATEIVARLREIAPAAELPDLPPAPGSRLVPRPRPVSRRTGGADGLRERVRSLSRGQLYAGLGAAAVLLVVLVLAVSGAFGGGDDDSGAATADETEQTAGQEVERIPLAAVGNGNASGEAVVGITTADQPYIDLILRDLEPAPEGQVYVVWFLFDQDSGYPLSPIAPDADGSFSDRFAVPTAAIPVLERMRFLNVSLAPVQQVQNAIQQAVRRRQVVISKPGRSVLQNPQPLAAAPQSGGGGGGAGAGGGG